jgi:antitoxin ParD1/3/4
MDVTLSPELERLVNEKVASGLYESAGEVVRAALRLLKETDEARNLALAELRKDVLAGLAALDRGESVDLDVSSLKAQVRSQRT